MWVRDKTSKAHRRPVDIYREAVNSRTHISGYLKKEEPKKVKPIGY